MYIEKMQIIIDQNKIKKSVKIQVNKFIKNISLTSRIGTRIGNKEAMAIICIT